MRAALNLLDLVKVRECTPRNEPLLKDRRATAARRAEHRRERASARPMPHKERIILSDNLIFCRLSGGTHPRIHPRKTMATPATQSTTDKAQSAGMLGGSIPAGKPVEAKRKLLMCVDKSKPSKAALMWAVDSLFRDNDEVYLVTVFEERRISGIEYVTADYKRLLEINEKWLKKVKETSGKMLQDYVAEGRKRGLKSNVRMKVLEVREGESAKHTICKYAGVIQPAMLLLGSRGLGAVGRTFLGSVSDYCVHNANVPVLVIK